ncbi:MAG TPA: FKBP-type peptidyl-prolyl cis-trans isomerase [Candidatus Saccharimonadales bacterium]|nr:FKBP-type peptidyl-prolyl cis-trans isomerase [Candidatus Saccharimonadales bacterium]
MTQVRQRFFAGFGAFLFLASASALTIFVIMQSTSGDSTQSTSKTPACSTSQSGQTLAVPDIYKPTEPVTTLQTTDLDQGKGPGAKNGDCLVVKYYGTLASDGTKFDEDFTDSTAFGFTLGQGAVIAGWDQGLVGMKAGGMRRLVIPASLAYGDQAQGAIPANSDLVFVVKLLKIQN